MAILKRLSDKKGDSGNCVQSIKWDNAGNFLEITGNKPTIGESMLVGSITARSYQDQDYWLTTEVTEILEEKENYFKFKTKNSIYELWY